MIDTLYSMADTLIAIAKLCLLIALGWALANNKSPKRMRDHFSESFWGALATFVYFICVPSLMIVKLDTFTWNTERQWFVLATALSMVAAILLSVLVYWPLKANAADKRTMKAITFQPNCVFLGFPLIEGLMGSEGLQLAIVFAGFSWPIMTMASIAILVSSDDSAESGGIRTAVEAAIKKLLVDPVMIGCSIGLVLSIVPWDLPTPVKDPVAMVGGLTSTLALIIIGAWIKLTEVGSARSKIGLISFMKLVVIPVAAWAIVSQLPITNTQIKTLVLLSSMPLAASTALLVKMYGGNTPLTANAITISTFASIVTMTVFTLLLS